VRAWRGGGTVPVEDRPEAGQPGVLLAPGSSDHGDALDLDPGVGGEFAVLAASHAEAEFGADALPSQEQPRGQGLGEAGCSGDPAGGGPHGPCEAGGESVGGRPEHPSGRARGAAIGVREELACRERGEGETYAGDGHERP
jgi:hypothetical protein